MVLKKVKQGRIEDWKEIRSCNTKCSGLAPPLNNGIITSHQYHLIDITTTAKTNIMANKNKIKRENFSFHLRFQEYTSSFNDFIA